jgi:hypothetical protein
MGYWIGVALVESVSPVVALPNFASAPRSPGVQFRNFRSLIAGHDEQLADLGFFTGT